MKIVSSGKGIHSPEFHKKKTREQFVRRTAFSFLALVIIGLPIYLLRNDHFLITNIEIVGNSVTPSEEIESIAAKRLEGNYLWIIPKSNILLSGKDKIKADLLASLPRLMAADVSIQNLRSLKIKVSEREPKALYCADTSAPTLPKNCFFIDASGYIFSEAPMFSDGVYFVYASDPSLEAPLRQQYLEPKAFSDVETFIASIGQFGVHPKVFIEKGDEYRLVLAHGGVIMWKASDDLERVRSNLESFIKDPNFQKDQGNLDRILYIDLRFGNKIFYKFEGEV